MVDQDGAVGGMVGPVPRRVIDYQLYYTINTLLKVGPPLSDKLFPVRRVFF